MDKNNSHTYYNLFSSLAHICTIVRLYTSNHPAVKKRLGEIFIKANALISDKHPLVFSISQNIFFINGEEIKAKNAVTKQFIKNFHDLQIGSIELTKGLTLEEFSIFMNLLSRAEGVQGEGQIKQYLKGKGVQHLIILFAAYKLVKETEDIVEKDTVLKIDELPPDLVERFTQDLKKSEVGEQFKKQAKGYKSIAHDPTFLSKLVNNLVKARDSAEEYEKMLWSIGDYLIDEVENLKTEKINRKILDALKGQLFSLWEKGEKEEQQKEKIQKIFTEISDTMQLKALALLYKKRKKSLETVTKKLKKIWSVLPPESRTYKKTKEILEKIGISDF